VAKVQPQKQITEPTQEKVEVPKGVPSQAASEHKQEKPIVPQPVLSAGNVFRNHLKNGQEGPEMVMIPAGSFQMGDRTVRIQKPFALGRYEVTFEEYDQFANATNSQLPSDKGWGRGRRPVIRVSWDDAVNYTKWLSAQTGKRYRLPTEAEWEYAARSGGKEERWAGTSREEELGGYAWYKANSGGETQPVGRRKPNGLGLYDMSGNVWEWVDDCWYGKCDQRVVRGGSWYGDPVNLRSSTRHRYNADTLGSNLGFRVTQDLD
jgi:formylglycine-generating enzyme required for sulfatase activity